MTTMLAPPTATDTVTRRQADYMAAWRELWLDHVYWTRTTISGIVHDTPGLQQVEARLLRNVDDMTGLLAPAYGTQTLAGLQTLLRDHLLTAARLVSDLKTGSPDAAEAQSEWFVNAANIAESLSSSNPYLPYEEVKELMDAHLALLKEEMLQLLRGEFDKEVATFERVESHALMMADAISAAVIRQFPADFA